MAWAGFWICVGLYFVGCGIESAGKKIAEAMRRE